MLDGLEPFDRLPADPLRWRVGRDEVRVCGFQVLKLAQEPVKFLVADDRRGLDVVQIIVAVQLFAKVLNPLLHRLCHGEFSR